uniref:Uncharacterized protein n=1 Tax=Eutreptiella gymnastica TaxID=73025 RepID=A0A7S1IYF5_9EUGL|mmetsp:Transcript_52821/g.94297  ORF Transcript_52821/g.94297 Transcript_52821/m.94297 type:complete len:126 (+) Transcript_52821:306-683(+)
MGAPRNAPSSVANNCNTPRKWCSVSLSSLSPSGREALLYAASGIFSNVRNIFNNFRRRGYSWGCVADSMTVTSQGGKATDGLLAHLRWSTAPEEIALRAPAKDSHASNKSWGRPQSLPSATAAGM